jgi:hypothetical protein
MTYEMTVVIRPTRLDSRISNRSFHYTAMTHRVEGKFLHITHKEGVNSFHLKCIERYYMENPNEST